MGNYRAANTTIILGLPIYRTQRHGPGKKLKLGLNMQAVIQESSRVLVKLTVIL